ncbi:MaoC/PaaZ C-terminal domain-containing protein [Streptomyces sp. NPDC058321]|uniref:MaoC/PaaZ C-terminal domain-containing protein n=1 Tax=Streptomyces sp. NPDC058321 TaxID=3346445 RepID=UPI0036EC5DB1
MANDKDLGGDRDKRRELYELPPSFAFSTRSRGRTITEGDFSAMTNLTWTFEEIHTDRILMKERGSERMLAGGCVLAFALGLATPAIKNQVVERGIKLIALIGYDTVRFHSPLFPGDTVYVESTLASVARTSRPERGVINFDDVLVDSDGRKILSYSRSALCDVTGSQLFVAQEALA